MAWHEATPFDLGTYGFSVFDYPNFQSSFSGQIRKPIGINSVLVFRTVVVHRNNDFRVDFRCKDYRIIHSHDESTIADWDN